MAEVDGTTYEVPGVIIGCIIILTLPTHHPLPVLGAYQCRQVGPVLREVVIISTAQRATTGCKVQVLVISTLRWYVTYIVVTSVFGVKL